ncbi:MAG: phosphoadenylyl-sulfate reductase [Thermodesulfobacteriota bacterium]
MESNKKWTPERLKEIGNGFEGKDPKDVIKWAIGEFLSSITLACSFGAEDVALVDMVVKVNPDTNIFYLDTNVLFKETYEVRDRLIKKYGVSPVKYQSSITLEEQAEKYGDKLWEKNPGECCKIRKIGPLRSALKRFDAWITGIRRDQAPTRANAGIVEWDNAFGLVKINPLAAWTSEDVWDYIKENEVPYNVLHDRNYPSIGCEHCTNPVMPGEDPRAGRWAGFKKTECGLHE